MIKAPTKQIKLITPPGEGSTSINTCKPVVISKRKSLSKAAVKGSDAEEGKAQLEARLGELKEASSQLKEYSSMV